jgi:hypothetical protein
MKQIIKIFKSIKDKTKENYSIEYHLFNGRYYPKLGGMFMIKNNINNEIDLVEKYMYQYCLFYLTKDDALLCIEDFKKQEALKKIEIIHLEN